MNPEDSIRASLAKQRREEDEEKEYQMQRIEEDPLTALDNAFDELDLVIETIRERGFHKQANEIGRLGAQAHKIAETVLEAG
jgi:3-hydroxyacyl-CoA dehydrogenase